jgi:hypothetical protein
MPEPEEPNGLLPGRGPTGRGLENGLLPGRGPGVAGCGAAVAGAIGTSVTAVGGVTGAGATTTGAISIGVSTTTASATGAAAAFLVARFGLGSGTEPAGKASCSRRATGDSIVEEAERTNSPISLSLANKTLLSTPSSLANS